MKSRYKRKADDVDRVEKYNYKEQKGKERKGKTNSSRPVGPYGLQKELQKQE